MKRFGIKTIVFLICVPPAIAFLSEYLSNSIYKGVQGGLITLVISVVSVFFSCKIIRVNDEEFTIDGISFEWNNVEVVNLRLFSLVGMTTVTVVLKSQQEYSFSTFLLPGERRKFIKFCQSKKIESEEIVR